MVEPAERTGTHGGVLRVFHRDAPVVHGLENPLGMDPAVRGVLLNLAAGWWYGPDGRQLPYLDQIQSLVVMNPEVVTAKTSTGQVAFSAIGHNTADIPLFRRGEAAGGFTTRVWNRLHGVDVVIQPNQTVTDPDKRALFRDFRFRRALSIALDRDEMDAVIYFGRALPRQTTVIPSSVFYDPAFAAAHIEHDPAEAARLLAELGLVDRDGDGLRELPDGRPLGMAPAPAAPALCPSWLPSPIPTPSAPTSKASTSTSPPDYPATARQASLCPRTHTAPSPHPPTRHLDALSAHRRRQRIITTPPHRAAPTSSATPCPTAP